MYKVKERILSLKDQIEDAEQRELSAKNALREIDGNLDRLEGERTTLLSRINVIGSEIDKINGRLDERSSRLEDAVARTEKSEERRLVLADTEVDDFERSEEIESSIKSTTDMKEEAEHLVVQAERRVIVLENDLAKARDRHDKFAVKINELTEWMEESGERIRDLEEKDRDASEREDIEFEKAKFLEVQLQESVNAAEELERDVGKLERLQDQLIMEIESWHKKEDEIREGLERDMGNLLDDI